MEKRERKIDVNGKEYDKNKVRKVYEKSVENREKSRGWRK